MTTNAPSLPKISVFLPVYNQEKYIVDAVDSILIQSYPNLQIVIGDDGSNDQTVEIIKNYKALYPELIKLVLSKENTGITSNCNRILAECDGDYIAMFAGDDIWLPGKLNAQVKAVIENPDVAMCSTSGEVFLDSTGEILRISPNLGQLNSAQGLLSRTVALGEVGCSLLIARWAMPSRGFDPRCPSVSDWLFWVETISSGRHIHLDNIFIRYRRHERNASANALVIYAERLIALDIMEQKFPELALEIYKFRRHSLTELICLNKLHSKVRPDLIIFVELGKRFIRQILKYATVTNK
jgi:glycosyltransferase involved in cell wall biosynthesis